MAAARRARYDALTAEARRVGAGGIAVAHTATDQAETLLDRLVRGAGVRGLAAMARERPIDATGDLVLARPLLSVTRAQVEQYVHARNLHVVRDPTNEDLHYRRSRLRHEVLPLLRRERPDVDRALAETCDRLRAEADALDALAADAYEHLCAADTNTINDDGSLDAAALAALPPALFARVIARAAAVPLAAVHVDALARLCADRRGTRSLDLPGNRTAERRYGALRFGSQSEKSASNVTEEVAVGAAGLYLLAGMPIEVSSGLYEALGSSPLTLRHVRAGDRMRRRKLQDVLVDAKVPRPERARTPVLARGSDVMWVQGLRLTGKGAVQ
jgi:tRNA(Ile)-lysidine synthase